MPALLASSASARAERGVCSAGLITIAQPAAIAGATLRVIMALGKFQGVIATHTPMGCLRTMKRLSLQTVLGIVPETLFASSANHSINEAPYNTSPADSVRGLPCSRVINTAKSSLFCKMRSNHLRIKLARSLAVLSRHFGKALFAAVIAFSASLAPRLVT